MKITRLLSTLAVAALATLRSTSTAAPGDLDLTFGGTGKIIADFNNGTEPGSSVAVQADGKIVVAGSAYNGSNYDFAVVRYNSNGTLDTSFNGTGKITTPVGNGYDIGRSVGIQSDGKIVLAGDAYTSGSNHGDIALVRYNANGSLDTGFNGTGKVITSIGSNSSRANSVTLQGDGKIVAAGYANSGYDFAVVRYNSNGTLDTTFNGSGRVITAIQSGLDIANSVAVQDDGKIVLAGYSSLVNPDKSFAVVRYNANGSLDTGFGIGGKVTTAINVGSIDEEGRGLAIQKNGKIVVAGFSTIAGNYDFAVVRYTANGTLDATFNGNGKVTTAIGSSEDRAQSVAVQVDGRIVVAGSSNGNFALVRYNSDGTLDTAFNATGKVTTVIGSGSEAQSVAVQTDGKIVVAGVSENDDSNYQFAVVRYEGEIDTDGDGIPDRFETGTGIYVSPTDTGTSPTNPDSDGDGLTDGKEVNTYHSNPNIKDTDGDGFEVATGFDPNSAASAPDLVSTILAAVEYRFTGASGVSYRIEASTDLANWTTIETNLIGTGGVITRFYSIEGQPKRYFRSRRN